MEKIEEMHLDIYRNKSILYSNGTAQEFSEGIQDEETKINVEKIKTQLDGGFLEHLKDNVQTFDFSQLDENTKQLIDSIVGKVTSEVGRALVGLTFLQLTIKCIAPSQCIRLHKGGSRKGSFSWKNGISMRTLDSTYNTPFLRKYDLLNINKDGIMMTRSLAENYPYSQLYKAEMRGPFHEWITIVDSIEDGSVNPIITLNYLLSLLINRSSNIEKLGTEACIIVNSIIDIRFEDCKNALIDFFESTKYSARAYEVVIHSFMQAYIEMGYTEYSLVPMSQMRSANKKHGNIGDIELSQGKILKESWDAKYGKPYLYEELGELKDKLEEHLGVKEAGFIVNKDAIIKDDITEKIEDVSSQTGVDIKIFNFTDWVTYKLKDVSTSELDEFGKHWIIATIESFARKRLDLAPIDEPCDGWLKDLVEIMKKHLGSIDKI